MEHYERRTMKDADAINSLTFRQYLIGQAIASPELPNLVQAHISKGRDRDRVDIAAQEAIGFADSVLEWLEKTGGGR